MKFFLEGEDEDLVERDGESYEVDSSREKFFLLSTEKNFMRVFIVTK